MGFAIFRRPLTSAPPSLRAPFFLTPLRNTAAKDILDRSSLRRRLTTAYGSSILRRRHTVVASYDDGSVLRRRQRTTTTAASYHDGRRRQRHDKGDCGSTKATAVCVDGRQRRIVRGQRHRPISSEDDGSGRHRRRRHRQGRQHQSRPWIETTINSRPG